MSHGIEEILEPDLPIVDAHHHLWFATPAELDALAMHRAGGGEALLKIYGGRQRYLFDEFMADVRSGHNVRATVFVQVHAMYRAFGPEELRSVGEVEFANGMAAMAASGVFGEARLCAGIIGGVDLRLARGADAVLRAHIAAGNGRYRGIRGHVGYDPNLPVLGTTPHTLLDPMFRAGFGLLSELGLSYDAWVVEPQLPELIDLARAFPETQIILDHMGSPLRLGTNAGSADGRFNVWRDNIRTLASCANVTVKLGGLGNPLCGMPASLAATPSGSGDLAQEWRPYIETCIEAFGARRCMFQSNYPVDASAGSYAAIWNAFKRIVSGASAAEKTALFSGTAARLYRLEL
jgi:L-fuconolactonase